MEHVCGHATCGRVHCKHENGWMEHVCELFARGRVHTSIRGLRDWVRQHLEREGWMDGPSTHQYWSTHQAFVPACKLTPRIIQGQVKLHLEREERGNVGGRQAQLPLGHAGGWQAC